MGINLILSKQTEWVAQKVGYFNEVKSYFYSRTLLLWIYMHLMHETLVRQRMLHIEIKRHKLFLFLFSSETISKKTNCYLTLCTNSYVASNRGLWSLLNRLLNADICKCIFSKYGTSIEVGCHKATVTRKCLEEICDEFNTLLENYT